MQKKSSQFTTDSVIQSHQFMKYLQDPSFSYFVYTQVSAILQTYDSHVNLTQLADDIAIWLHSSNISSNIGRINLSFTKFLHGA